MNTIFKNSKNSRTIDPYRLLLNLAGKPTKKEVINALLYQILAYNIYVKT